MFRPDNSLDSANNPVQGNMPEAKDFGLHKAIVLQAVYTDDQDNTTKSSSAPRVLYKVQVIGGPRDGQLFAHAEDMTQFGGVSNYSERIWKGTTTFTRSDIANLALTFEPLNKLNGDVVYIQFIGGDINFPIIVGGAKHSSNAVACATLTDGPRFKTRFNGITKEINKDGEYTWTKANGAYTPVPLPDIEGNAIVIQDQFAVLPGFQEAVKITLGNQFDYKMKMNVTPGNGMEISIDGIADELKVTTLIGASFSINGISDKIEAKTFAGMAFSLDGLSDKMELKALTGASITVDGLSDEVALKTTAGAQLTVSGTSGVSIKDALGDALTLGTGAVELKNATGAKISFDAAGFIKLGNNSGDVLAILGEAFTALSTQTAAGFGAPTSTVADFAQLLIKLKLISG